MIEYCDEILDLIKNGYNLSHTAFKIGEAAITGMLYEASTSPSPGLVSPISNGVHRDMNFFTFLRSTSSIAYGMYLCAQVGIDYEKDILKKIRSIGRSVEIEMLTATGGVNTQLGLLFVGGIVCAAAGGCFRKKLALDRHNISRECKEISSGLIERELESLDNKKKLTNGEKIYISHRITGIRGEVEKGLSSVIYTGLALYEQGIKSGLGTGAALSHSLVGLMTVVEDTVVINKAGLEGLAYMKAEAIKALDLGGMYTAEGTQYIKKMEEDFIKRHISPGGAADLLAITAMIYELEKMKLKMK